MKMPELQRPAIIGNKPKIMKKVLYSIIDPVCFAKFTWSGRGKIAFRNYKKILQLLHTIVKGDDKSYNNLLFEFQLKDKVIKHAHE